MHLSNSAVPKDPNLAALILPGAAPAGVATPAQGVRAEAEEPVAFERLFSEVATAERGSIEREFDETGRDARAPIDAGEVQRCGVSFVFVAPPSGRSAEGVLPEDGSTNEEMVGECVADGCDEESGNGESGFGRELPVQARDAEGQSVRLARGNDRNAPSNRAERVDMADERRGSNATRLAREDGPTSIVAQASGLSTRAFGEKTHPALRAPVSRGDFGSGVGAKVPINEFEAGSLRPAAGVLPAATLAQSAPGMYAARAGSAEYDSPAVDGNAPAENAIPLPRAITFPASEANFADRHRKNFTRDYEAGLEGTKSFVCTAPEAVTRRRSDVGIGVAKPHVSMPAPSLFVPLLHPASEYATVTASATPIASAGETTPATSAPAEPESAGTVHRAVEAVLHAIEQSSTREQKAVNLRFTVGDANLEVRIELHAEEVRTTFRTDSAELRGALSQEWQAVTSTTNDRPVRLAPAVFATSHSGSGDFSGDASSRHREDNAHGDEAGTAADVRAALRGSVANNSRIGSGVTTSSPAPRTVSATSRHLHTLA